jgi:hypothetical protein
MLPRLNSIDVYSRLVVLADCRESCEASDIVDHHLSRKDKR